MPGGWGEPSATTGGPAKGKGRIRGKLSVKEIKEMKKSCHNIEGMFLNQKLPTIKVTSEDVQHNTSLGPSATLVSSEECTGVQSRQTVMYTGTDLTTLPSEAHQT